MKKQRKRLSNSEATLLGIQPKPQDKKGENTRYMITGEQFKSLIQVHLITILYLRKIKRIYLVL